MALAATAAGRAPAVGAICPSKPSSPNASQPDSASGAITPIAAIRPSAIGRS